MNTQEKKEPIGEVGRQPRPSTMPPEASTSAGDTASRISGTNTIFRHQHHNGQATVVVAAGLPALRHDHLDTVADGLLRRFHPADLLPRRQAGIAEEPQVLGRRMTPVKGGGRHLFFGADADLWGQGCTGRSGTKKRPSTDEFTDEGGKPARPGSRRTECFH